MERKNLIHYKEKLNKEKREILETLNKVEDNEFNTNLQDEIEELSVYDNHPGDIGTETFQMEMKYALENHQKEELKNIDEALKKIELGNYGICEYCGDTIRQERLEYLPAAKFCLQCAKKRISPKDVHYDRPVEENVLFPPFGRTNTDYEDSTFYDGEDTWQDVEQHSSSSEINNRRREKDTVEKVDEISNQEYKNQLPD